MEAALPDRDVLALDVGLGLVADPVAEMAIEVVHAMPEIRFRDFGERWRAGVRPHVCDDCLRQFVGMSLDEPDQIGGQHVTPPFLLRRR